MAGIRSILVLALLCGMTIPGCISFGDTNVNLDLQVNHSILNGTVVESYVDGQLTSLDSVTIVVDFSETESEIPLKRFGIEFEGDRDAIEIDAKSESSISVEFSTHGL